MNELIHIVDMRGELHRFYGDPTWVSTLLTYLFIGILSIIPSVYLLYLFTKKMLYRNNFYFVIMHWTTVNLISIITTIICTIMKSRVYGMGNMILFTDTAIRTIPVMFGIFFIYNKFVRSKHCPHIIYGTWIVFAIMLIIGNVCATSDPLFIYYVCLTYVFVIINLLAILMVVTASFCYCVVGSNEETLKVRLIILAVYLVTCIGHWTYALFSPQIAFSVSFFLISMLFYCNSLINLVLLVIYDKHISEYFWLFLEKKCHLLKMRSSTEKLDGTKQEI